MSLYSKMFGCFLTIVLKGRLMRKMSFFILAALILVNHALAQDGLRISRNDFIEVLGSERKYFRSTDFLYASTKLMKESAAMVKNNPDEAIRRGVVGLVLAMHSNKISKIKGSETWNKSVSAVEKAKNTYSELGVTEEIFETARLELESYLAVYGVSDNRKFPKKAIDVIGVVPGVSVKADLEELKMRYGVYQIGGYNIICEDDLDINKVVQRWTCYFGKEVRTYEETKSGDRPVSHDEVFSSYLAGFSKKYGKPKINVIEASNAFGRKVEVTNVKWIDSYGNMLTIISNAFKIGEGVLLLESSDYLKNQKKETDAKDSLRRF